MDSINTMWGVMGNPKHLRPTCISSLWHVNFDIFVNFFAKCSIKLLFSRLFFTDYSLRTSSYLQWRPEKWQSHLGEAKEQLETALENLVLTDIKWFKVSPCCSDVVAPGCHDMSVWCDYRYNREYSQPHTAVMLSCFFLSEKFYVSLVWSYYLKWKSVLNICK